MKRWVFRIRSQGIDINSMYIINAAHYLVRL